MTKQYPTMYDSEYDILTLFKVNIVFHTTSFFCRREKIVIGYHRIDYCSSKCIESYDDPNGLMLYTNLKTVKI